MMSTKSSLRYHSEEGGAGFNLYRECFDFDDEFVYLEVHGVPFETSSSIGLSGNGPGSVTIRLPDDWARKLGLISGQKRGSETGDPGRTDREPDSTA
jgi:hypothetical protein